VSEVVGIVDLKNDVEEKKLGFFGESTDVFDNRSEKDGGFWDKLQK